MMKHSFGLLLAVFFCIYVSDVCSQTLEEAKAMYLNGEYAKSLPAFEKAIKLSPNNPSYNQWYGNCLLETGKLNEAENYLKFASAKNVKESFFSLGKLYFTQYRFKESEEAYEKYLVFLKKEKKAKEISDIETLRDQSMQAARMLEHCEDVQIIDSVVVSKKDFLKTYEMLNLEAGSISELNNFPVYENQLKDKRYYAKLDNRKKYRLYSQHKLMDKWSDETLLPLSVDSLENVSYPFVLSDGVTVYYASTGQGSIGGYDLFITRYNSGSETYYKPEQLGMPFNSPYNDYMLAIDEYNEIGYFASDRFQPEGKVVVYTFIPNKEKITVKTDDENYLIDRAKITAVKQSWVKGVNYQAKLQQIRFDRQKNAEKVAREFDFVINDDMIYHKSDDFKSSAAKQSFFQYQNLKKQIDSLSDQLERNRKIYKEGNTAKKNSLTQPILSDERKMEDLTIQYSDLAVKIRNTEIKYLKNTK